MQLPDLRGHSDEPVYNIKAVVQATSVPAPTLRSWERRYGFPTPERGSTGYRRYSDREVAAIQWVRARVEEGMAVSQAIALVQAGQRRLQRRPEPRRITPSGLVPALAGALIGFDAAAADRILGEAFSMYGVEDTCQDLITPVLHEIGERWAAGTVSVGMEHFSAHLIRRKLEALRNLGTVPWRPQPLLVACPAGEHHELALLMLAVFMLRRGYSVLYLGQNVPRDDLRAAVQSLGPAAVCLSATRRETLDSLREMAATVRALPLPPEVVAGGQAVDADPSVVERLGAHYLGRRLPLAADTLAALISRR